MTLSDLISKIFNDTKRRTVSLRQLSFLLPSEEEDHVSDSESVVDKTAHDVGTDAFNSVQNDDDVSVETDSMFEYDTQFASNVKNKYVAEEYDSVGSFILGERTVEMSNVNYSQNVHQTEKTSFDESEGEIVHLTENQFTVGGRN